MTVRIQREFSFTAGLFFDNEFFMNTYQISAHFNVESTSIFEQNIALQRAKYFFNETIDSAIFVRDNDIERMEKLNEMGFKTCPLPEEPYDQIIGIIVFTKLNSILEEKLVLTDIQLSSDMCDGVSYLHSMEENLGPFNLKGWWNENNPNISNPIKLGKGKKVVKLNKKINNWEELNLGFTFVKEKQNNSSEVLFASFAKKDN